MPAVDEVRPVYKLGDEGILLDIPSDLAATKGMAKFWEALHSLGLDAVANGFSGITSHWPSRLSLLNVEKSAVEEYLKAYLALIREVEQQPHLSWLLSILCGAF